MRIILNQDNIGNNDGSGIDNFAANFNSLKDEALCSKFLRGRCMEGTLCNLVHPDSKSPFLWQYCDQDKWKPFSSSVNVEVEKYYCGPSNIYLNFQLSSEIFDSLTVDFSHNGPIWNGTYSGRYVNVRRLSTKSSVLAEDNENGGSIYLTQWKWYWEKTHNVWEEYSGVTNSELIEKSFVSKKNVDYRFQISEFNYALNFTTMQQQNLGPQHFTKRNVRRRPVFQNVKGIIKFDDVQGTSSQSSQSKAQLNQTIDNGNMPMQLYSQTSTDSQVANAKGTGVGLIAEPATGISAVNVLQNATISTERKRRRSSTLPNSENAPIKIEENQLSQASSSLSSTLSQELDNLEYMFDSCHSDFDGNKDKSLSLSSREQDVSSNKRPKTEDQVFSPTDNEVIDVTPVTPVINSSQNLTDVSGASSSSFASISGGSSSSSFIDLTEVDEIDEDDVIKSTRQPEIIDLTTLPPCEVMITKVKEASEQPTDDYSEYTVHIPLNKLKTLRPSVKVFFNYILHHSKDGAIPLKKFMCYFHSNEEDALSWIRLRSQSFRISGTKDGLRRVHLCLDNVMPCYDYWSESGCHSNESPCKMFHICKKFLHGIKHSEISCKFNHDITNPVQREVAAEFNLQSLSPDHLLMLLRTRFPFVCGEYLKGNCLQSDSCSNIHVCGDFIEGKCKKANGLCNHRHESGLRDKHTVGVMSSFHVIEENYRKCIIYKEDVPISLCSESSSKMELKQSFNSLKDQGICYKFLNDTCMEGKTCSLEHPDPKTTFLWQYHEDDAWKSFVSSINTEVETFYCVPSNTSFKSPSLTLDFSGHGPTWSGTYLDNQVEVRRLSTKSFVISDDGTNDDQVVGLTEWKWYWEKNKKKNVWEEYSGLVTSRDIESSFINLDVKHNFQTKELGVYSLAFAKMEQQNLDPAYPTKRRVRRRPVFQDIKEIMKVKEPSSQFPQHWPKEMKDGQCIAIENSEQLLHDFKKSIRKAVHVVSIEEVCNREFYTKYTNNKKIFMNKHGKDKINEKLLYHGTTSDVAPQICVQNFDWRLNGKNATVYGHGSYFARDASYSDAYAWPDANGVQYMFIAQVLVGKYTRGRKGLKRPPADKRTPGALYDSCVDFLTDPSIFVIFEREQCYPKYLIKYKKKSPVHNSTSFSNPAPSIPNLTPSISNLAPSISNLVPSNSNLGPSISNLAPSISNLAPSNSNLAPSNSNLAPSISNLAPSISNLAASNSNLAPSISNLAPSISNLAPSISNLLPSNSNPAPPLSTVGPAFNSPYQTFRPGISNAPASVLPNLTPSFPNQASHLSNPTFQNLGTGFSNPTGSGISNPVVVSDLGKGVSNSGTFSNSALSSFSYGFSDLDQALSFGTTDLSTPDNTTTNLSSTTQVQTPTPTSAPKQSFVPQSLQDLKTGIRVTVAGFGQGIIRWIGSAGQSQNIGVELDWPFGYSNGNLNGTQLFTCSPFRGVFVGLQMISSARS